METHLEPLKMAPIAALEGLERGMLAELNRLRAHLVDEASEIAELWDGLGRVNGQREDHAAALLGRLRGHLSAISLYCQTCEKQIDAMIADPFGRND